MEKYRRYVRNVHKKRTYSRCDHVDYIYVRRGTPLNLYYFIQTYHTR